MGCGCKSDGKSSIKSTTENQTVGNSDNILKKVGNVILKIIGFVIFLVMLPIINLFIIKFIFEILVLNKKVDFINILSFVTNKIKPKDIEDDEDDEEETDEEEVEYELQDVEVIR